MAGLTKLAEVHMGSIEVPREIHGTLEDFQSDSKYILVGNVQWILIPPKKIIIMGKGGSYISRSS